MIKSQMSWTTNDGKIFIDYEKAVRHELTTIFKIKGDNEVGARKIVESLDLESLDNIIFLISQIRQMLIDRNLKEPDDIESDGKVVPIVSAN